MSGKFKLRNRFVKRSETLTGDLSKLQVYELMNQDGVELIRVDRTVFSKEILPEFELLKKFKDFNLQRKHLYFKREDFMEIVSFACLEMRMGEALFGGLLNGKS